MYKAIIFDFFDVIRTDAYKSWLAAHNVKNADPYLEAARQQDLGNITTEQFLAKVSNLAGRPVTREEMDETASVDQEVVKIVAKLYGHVRLGLLSNAPSALIREILDTHKLEHYFNSIIVSSEVGFAKPSQEIFTLALTRLGVKPAETIFVDDNERYILAAEKLGVQGVQFISAAQLRISLSALGFRV